MTTRAVDDRDPAAAALRRARWRRVPLLAALLLAASPAGQAAECRPTLTLADIGFTGMLPPTRERRWTATVRVDAARCVPGATGAFAVAFERQKENAPDLVFRERFTWRAPSVQLVLDVWADESVARAWIESVEPCGCAP